MSISLYWGSESSETALHSRVMICRSESCLKVFRFDLWVTLQKHDTIMRSLSPQLKRCRTTKTETELTEGEPNFMSATACFGGLTYQLSFPLCMTMNPAVPDPIILSKQGVIKLAAGPAESSLSLYYTLIVAMSSHIILEKIEWNLVFCGVFDVLLHCINCHDI